MIDRSAADEEYSGQTSRRYGVAEWPTMIVVDQQGQVVGPIPKKKLAETISRLLGDGTGVRPPSGAPKNAVHASEVRRAVGERDKVAGWAQQAAVDQPAPDEFPLPVAAERRAAQRVQDLGGWYELDGDRHVIEVNMVYHVDGFGHGQDNPQNSDGALHQIDELPRLKRLYLKETQASDEGLEVVGRLPELEVLYMWSATHVTDSGVAYLRNLSKLKELHLSISAITDEAIVHLSEIASIERLSIAGNAFTDRALEYASRLPRLRILIPDNSYSTEGSDVPRKARFTEEGMKHVRKMPMLEELWLKKTGLTEDGIKPLRGLKTLKLLVLDDPDKGEIREAAILDLQKATPQLKVSANPKVFPSVDAISAAADPKQKELNHKQAAEGLGTIERLLRLVSEQRDAEAALLSATEVAARIRGLYGESGSEPLKIVTAYGDGEHVLAVSTLVRTKYVVLKAARTRSAWRVESIDSQPSEGVDGLVQRFMLEYPGAQPLRPSKP